MKSAALAAFLICDAYAVPADPASFQLNYIEYCVRGRICWRGGCGELATTESNKLETFNVNIGAV